ncbi:hypothetical protein METP3_00279 [Methanosarcinales archaeon]|nr:hypothetical protein METP3_00279 [Methanosarcinales archaeon]
MGTLTEPEKKNLQQLKLKVHNGEIALFLGAGASLSSGGPTGKDLIQLIKEDFKDIDFGDVGNNLLDVCQEIDDNGHGPQLKRFISKIFYGLEPSSAHPKLPSFPWPVIYTTNYEDLIEKTFEECYLKNPENARRCKQILRGDRQYYLKNKEEVLLFKIMGDSKRDDPLESPVLTRNDFNLRALDRKRMLELLSSFVIDGEVLYIGYSFQDRIIFEVIDELSKNFGDRIGKSYALVPSIERGSKIEQLLIKRNIIPLPLTFEEFIKELEEEKPVSLVGKNRHDILLKLKYGEASIPYKEYKEYEEYFKIINEYALSELFDKGELEEEKVRSFLRSRSESWEPFIKNWDFKRNIYLKIKSELESELNKKGPENNDAIIIEGGGGLGKSILLKRLAYDFYEAGNPVIILNSYLDNFDYKLIDKFCEHVNQQATSRDNTHKLIIILDNADANINHIKKLSIFLKNRSKSAVIVGATRPNEWAHAQNQWGYKQIVSDGKKFEILPKMDKNETKDLIKHIGKLLNMEDFSLNLDYWTDFVEKNYNNDFFATIYGLVDPARRKLDEIIWDEYKKLPSLPTRTVYEYVCLFSQYDLPLKLEMIVRPLEKKFNYSYREFANEIYKTEAKSLIVEIEGHYAGDLFYMAKNKIVAQKIVEKLFDVHDTIRLDDMVKRYVEILSEVKAMDKVEMDIAKSLLVKYLGPNGIDNKKINEDNLIKLYDSLINNGIEESTILHHYGILERNRGNFEKSDALLKKSLQISRKYKGSSLGIEQEKNILNSLGVLYSKEALKFESLGDLNSALNFYDKANFYFTSSKILDPTNVHAYHSEAFSSFLRGEYYEGLGLEKESYEYYTQSLKIIDEAKESISEYEIGALIQLETRIYNEKFGNYDEAKEIIQSFIDENPQIIDGYILISRLIFNEAKKHSEDRSVYISLLKSALSYAEMGLTISSKDQDLLKTQYYITKEFEPDNIPKLFDLLKARYDAFDKNCTELKLIFQLALNAFECKKYDFSKQLFRELDEKIFDHPLGSGILTVARDLKTMKRKIFTGYVSKFVSRKEAYAYSEEIGYPIKFIPFAQKREIHPRDNVEFNVSFNYRGHLAIGLNPI